MGRGTPAYGWVTLSISSLVRSMRGSGEWERRHDPLGKQPDRACDLLVHQIAVELGNVHDV